MISQALLESIDYRLISLLSPEQAHTFRAIPFELNHNTLSLAGDERTELQSSILHIVLGKEIYIERIATEELERYLSQYYPTEAAPSQSVTSEMAQDSDIIGFVNQMLEQSVAMGASDIHVERYELLARIRFRWEGQLVEKYEIPLSQYNAVVSRLKIMAELDISERRLPQDGRIQIRVGEKTIDLRVSTIPGKYGEKVVLRLLMRSQEKLRLSSLGLSKKEEEVYLEAIRRPNGLILITGPTGSGKTTTLYATLNLLNEPQKNLMTVEDPIEYNLSGINQVQVKESIGLSFDRALRAFLRQDPDIIMVGEIRDLLTAQIAVRAALTGHLVFSTLHTNSAWDSITRLKDMGVAPYLLAASLRLVVAQRLVRVLCPNCKATSHELSYAAIQKEMNLHTHFVPTGCAKCYYTGYKGRCAVFDILPVNGQLGKAIKLDGTPQLDQYYRSFGLPSLKDNLHQLLIEGVTSLEEAIMHWSGG